VDALKKNYSRYDKCSVYVHLILLVFLLSRCRHQCPSGSCFPSCSTGSCCSASSSDSQHAATGHNTASAARHEAAAAAASLGLLKPTEQPAGRHPGTTTSEILLRHRDCVWTSHRDPEGTCVAMTQMYCSSGFKMWMRGFWDVLFAHYIQVEYTSPSSS